MIIVSAFLLSSASHPDHSNASEESSVRKQWPQIDISSVVNSLTGTSWSETGRERPPSFIMARRSSHPAPDSAFTQDFGNLALLIHPAPRQGWQSARGGGRAQRDTQAPHSAP
jgi:hypothetical protein